MEQAIVVPDTKEIEELGSSLEERARAIAIVDDVSRGAAAALLLEVNAKLKVVEPVLEEPVIAANAFHKKMREWADRHLNPFKSIKRRMADQIGAYDLKVAEKRRLEDAKARALALAKAQKEREKEIRDAKASGDAEAAKNLKEAPLDVAPVVAKTPEPAKVAGVTTRFKWVVDSVDPNKLPRKYLIADARAIQKVVDALGAVHGIPGVMAKQVPITSGRVS